MISRLSRARVHEIPPLLVQPRNLEQVDNVVHIGFVQTKGRDRTRQVGVAVEVIRLAREHGVDIGVTPGAEQIVHAAPVLVFAVPREAVRNDGHQRPHIWQARPQPVMCCHVGGVQLLGPAGPEPLARVVGVPYVEVACAATPVSEEINEPRIGAQKLFAAFVQQDPDENVRLTNLGPLGGADPDDGASWGLPRLPGPDGQDKLLNEHPWRLLDSLIQISRHRQRRAC